MKRSVFLGLLFIAPLLFSQDVLRGEVVVELEPIYGGFMDVHQPIDMNAAYRRALEQAAMLFSGQIYGWSFYYDIGERARGIQEELELTPLGKIPWGDPRLFVTHARLQNRIVTVSMDYRPSEAQARRLQMWSLGNVRSAQAIGYGPLGILANGEDWFLIKQTALEDSARAAIRAMLQGSERNRPKEARGFISLQGFPHFYMDSGRWAARSRFRIVTTDIVPFAVH